MHANNRRIDHLDSGVLRACQCVHNSSPNARSSPANEAIVASGVWAESIGQIAPRCAASQHPKDAVEHAAVVHTRYAARLIRQHRLDGRPLNIAEFVAHDSRLRFGSLNHASASVINRPDLRLALFDLFQRSHMLTAGTL